MRLIIRSQMVGLLLIAMLAMSWSPLVVTALYATAWLLLGKAISDDSPTMTE